MIRKNHYSQFGSTVMNQLKKYHQTLLTQIASMVSNQLSGKENRLQRKS